MLAIFRILLIILSFILICTLGLVYCIFFPRKPTHVKSVSIWFSRLSFILGITVTVKHSYEGLLPKNCVYISNHQNNYDMFVISKVVQNRTVTVGKKDLLWIPFFGIFYWITGNFLIDRKNPRKSRRKLIKISEAIKRKDISILIFPEGTRNKSDELLYFKNGAFYVAILSKVPIVPICISNLHRKIHLNRWNNGTVTIEIMSPISTVQYSIKDIHYLKKRCFYIMKNKLKMINTYNN